MTRREKKKLQSDFLRKAGPNAATFKAAMDALPEVAFYMKDAEGRIMALNRRNCDICNIHDELDAVGLRSSDIFPLPLAQSYIANDQIVQKTRRPLINFRNPRAADWSNDDVVGNIFPLFDQAGTFIGTLCIYNQAPSLDGAPDWVADDFALLDLLYRAVEVKMKEPRKPNFRAMFEPEYRRLWLRQNRVGGLKDSLVWIFGR